VNKFTGHLQVITTNNYNTSAHSHTTNHSTLSLLSLFPFISTYIPQEQGGPVIPPGTGFPFRRLLRLAFYSRSTEHGRWSHIASERIYRKHRLQYLFYCVTSPRTRKLRALHSNGFCSQSRLLATGLYATVCLYEFN
jgi:hypothetical protein